METANNRDELARVRYDRAVELIAEAEGLLSNGAYKSANNRAFYAAEKAVKALLALKSKDSRSHTGLLRTFNEEYIHKEIGDFDKDDYKKLQRMGQIRSASDYDDFYVASKEESAKQVLAAKEFISKVKEYLSMQGVTLVEAASDKPAESEESVLCNPNEFSFPKSKQEAIERVINNDNSSRVSSAPNPRLCNPK